MSEMSYMEQELHSQPETWREAARLGAAAGPLPEAGQRVAVIGCGTSWFMAQSYAALREAAGQGVTDPFAASEAFLGSDRGYDAVVAITRSGTTTEVLRVLDAVKGRIPTVTIIGDPETPAVGLSDRTVALPFADEKSVVQTRFATTALTLLRAHLGEDISRAVTDAEEALVAPVEKEWVDAEQFSFLGTGWTFGLANEAALKMREASQSWTESYPAMEYRHGPIAIAAPGRVTWLFGQAPDGLESDVVRTGARFVRHARDPLADLVLVQRVALERARARGLDPDNPRSLTRSVMLEAPAAS
ncbi:fructoselysine-6-P-deglycase FrlB-like protein [Streptomyces sp. 2333.5]|uniref:SIS domain-containing protein n=1 Tax=Streptomyces TaxID=1883 RepID=UPI00089B399B|nr:MULTISPECIES: SIS domain-containing protein [unclassified Streptomyces]PJJ05623.1 fructoselysine-6-P-deglycase FrlB-like protein [Streptomyces sp. 2333.5]SEE80566.1 Fructoselysine-6-P-deglycase FrlB with duplicated sugar isomerase (SIS) domain [Streptomyces sp. 2314.4]SEF01766.1 Fructoselysine-6-P-deglycase FrlB with duplicated sugar isomerase (SIS) domain [Streptomyces sp. 2112.2]SOE10027.1 Fructoselysine-6-P-deglycase FrlB with duplicated sugar isomerase (SIS) domain [Streptomyces sp. 2323